LCSAARHARVGILGGTFDPIHIGHLILAEETRLSLALDRVIFIPAGRPWRKSRREVSPPADRVAMVSTAITANPHFELSRLEVDREGPTYTVDTLQELRAQWGPDTEVWFILGSDALRDLPHWRDPVRIISQARLAVAARSGLSDAEIAGLEQTIPGLGQCIDVVSMPAVGISSSELRRRLRESLSTRYWLPPGVEQYARAHSLYHRTPPPVSQSLAPEA